ncbi:PP2C family protein-serine/threonine phosphatase [Microbacterium sp. A93]|uniref:PP2C family protein-serine/threonine phosphatase n=1 Tax=Microbacterium sp. A93 TaxID=3450716 RepID=UPI003F43BF59
MSASLIVTSGSATHVGSRRTLNEDSLLASAPVFLVADGMGGHEAGERASAAALAEFERYSGRESLVLDDVRAAVSSARFAVDDISVSTTGRAGTTLSGVVLASVDGTGYWLVLNIGDSRTYRLSDGELEQISVDHSVVQELVESGELTAAEAATDHRRNIITRAIGGGSTGEADYWMFPADLGDRILICSDGLCSELSDGHIRDVLSLETDPQSAANVLVADAVSAGGRDNVTAVIVDAISVASHPGRPVETDVPDIADTRPREAAGGVRP